MFILFAFFYWPCYVYLIELVPVKKLKYDELNRKVQDSEYDELINYACDIGVVNAYIQEGETQKESFIPNFNKTGI